MKRILCSFILVCALGMFRLQAQPVSPRPPEILPYKQHMKGVSLAYVRVPAYAPAQGYRHIAEWLQGRIPGVQVITGGNRLPHQIRVIMRSHACITCKGVPMVFVDGIRVDEMQLGLLSPDEVYAVTVLKGPAATALYGTGAAEGVILIQTVGGRFVSQR